MQRAIQAVVNRRHTRRCQQQALSDCEMQNYDKTRKKKKKANAACDRNAWPYTQVVGRQLTQALVNLFKKHIDDEEEKKNNKKINI